MPPSHLCDQAPPTRQQQPPVPSNHRKPGSEYHREGHPMPGEAHHLVIISLDGVPRRVKIGHCPTLSLVGYLEPALHVLEVGNTIIKAGTSASPSTMVPSVKILGTKVCFGVRNDAKMLPGFLRCFPNLERLHLESYETDEPTGKLNNKFWQEAGAIECVQSHTKLLIFYGFRGERSELSFLKFFLESARMLTKLVIVVSKGSFTSMAEANSRVKPLLAAKPASPDSLLLLFESAFESGEDRWLLNFKRGSDFRSRALLLFKGAIFRVR